MTGAIAEISNDHRQKSKLNETTRAREREIQFDVMNEGVVAYVPGTASSRSRARNN